MFRVLQSFINPDYQYILSISDPAKEQATAATDMTTQPNVGLMSIQQYVWPLPPLAEQSCLVSRIEDRRRLCAGLRRRLGSAQVTQASLARASTDGAVT